jgi:hypothetical protein
MITSIQILVYIIFIIFIILIGYFFTNTNTNTKEGFTVAEDTLRLTINNELDKLNINNIDIQSKLYNYLSSLTNILNKYKITDAPITLNNDGNLCEYWNMYENGLYKDKNTSCIIIPGHSARKCLNNNSLTSCSNYYDDGEINKLNNINTLDILNSAQYNIFLGVSKLNSDLVKYNNDMTNKLNDFIAKRNLENQQLYFINYNNSNLDDKKKIFDKSNKDFEKSENEVNINKIQFQQLVKTNSTNDNKLTKYYNYITWLIISILVIGLLNFFFSEIL